MAERAGVGDDRLHLVIRNAEFLRRDQRPALLREREIEEGVELPGAALRADLADAALIFAAGFAPFRGGPLHFKMHEKVAPATATPVKAAAE